MLAFLLAAAPAVAQVSSREVRTINSAPTGNSCSAPDIRMLDASGVTYCCVSGTFVVCGSSGATNELQDRDGDGAMDFVVIGDYDGDGLYEHEDIQAALDALTDPDGRVAIIAPTDWHEWGSCVSGGEDCTHDQASTCPTGETCCATASDTCSFSPADSSGLLLIPDDTDISGPGATLHGLPWVDGSDQQAVLYVTGVSNVEIHHLSIDGGMCIDGDSGCPSGGYDGTTIGTKARMGIRLSNGTEHVSVHHVRVTRTHHAALYASKSKHVQFEDNTLEYVGNYPQVGGNAYNCVYIFDTDSGWTEDILVARNRCLHSGSHGYNVRSGTSGTDFCTNITFARNYAQDTDNGYHFHGVHGSQMLSNIADSTRGHGIVVEQVSTRGDNEDIAISGGLVSNAGNSGVQIKAENRRVTVDGVAITGTTGSCVDVHSQSEHVTLRNIDMRECGLYGITTVNITGAMGSHACPECALTIEGCSIDGVDAVDRTDGTYRHGIYLQAVNYGMRISNTRIAGFTNSGIFNTGAGDIDGAHWSGITIEDIPPQYSNTSGGIVIGSLPSCAAGQAGDWYWVTDGASATDCSTGAGSTNNWCMCNGTSYTDYNPPTNSGAVEFFGDITNSVVSDLLILNQRNKQSIVSAGATSNTTFDGAKQVNTHEAMAAWSNQDLFLLASPNRITIIAPQSSNMAAGADGFAWTGSAPVNVSYEFTGTNNVSGSCTSAVPAGTVFHDTNGDGTTNCNGGACYEAICASGGWYYH